MRSAPVRILDLGSLAVMMLVALACNGDSEPASSGARASAGDRPS